MAATSMYGARSSRWRQSRLDLENDFQFHGYAEWQARDAEDGAAGVSLSSKDILQHLRCGVGDLGLIANVSRCRHRDAEPDDTRHLVERSEMLSRHSEDIECRQMRCGPRRLEIELAAQTSCKPGRSVRHGKHAAQKE